MKKDSTSRPGKERYDFRVTLSGWLFLVAFVLIMLSAVNTQQALLFILFGLMWGAFVFSVIVVRRMLAAVGVLRDLPQRAFANRVVHLGYYLFHRGKGGAALGMELAEVRPPEPLQSVGAYCLHLPPGATFKSGSRLVVRQRGRYTLSTLRLSTRFPFSLLCGYRDVRQESALVVWPALGALTTDLLVRGAVEISDAAPSQVRAGSDEFFGLREYRQGDNPRFIHWKRTAALGEPVVREMAKPNPEVLYVVMDTQLKGAGPAALEQRERLIRFAATLIDHAFHREYRVGLATAYGERGLGLPAGGGKGHWSAALDALADIDPQADGSFAAALAALPRLVLRHAQVFVVTPDAARVGRLLPGACGRLSVITPEALDAMYEDAPSGDVPGDSPATGNRQPATGRGSTIPVQGRGADPTSSSVPGP